MFSILVTFHRSIETQRKAILRDHTTSLPLYTEKVSLMLLRHAALPVHQTIRCRHPDLKQWQAF